MHLVERITSTGYSYVSPTVDKACNSVPLLGGIKQRLEPYAPPLILTADCCIDTLLGSPATTICSVVTSAGSSVMNLKNAAYAIVEGRAVAIRDTVSSTGEKAQKIIGESAMVVRVYKTTHAFVDTLDMLVDRYLPDPEAKCTENETAAAMELLYIPRLLYIPFTIPVHLIRIAIVGAQAGYDLIQIKIKWAVKLTSDQKAKLTSMFLSKTKAIVDTTSSSSLVVALQQGKQDASQEDQTLLQSIDASKETVVCQKSFKETKEAALPAHEASIEEVWNKIAYAYLATFGDDIFMSLRSVFGNSMQLRLAEMSLTVKARFVKTLEEHPSHTVSPALHGTASKNLASIFKRGLLIPGQGNELEVVNGSVHGVGIYTANLNAPSLSRGFCKSGTNMLVCIVLQTESVKHVLDAQVVFDASHVVPVFVASAARFVDSDAEWLFGRRVYRIKGFQLPEPISASKFLHASPVHGVDRALNAKSSGCSAASALLLGCSVDSLKSAGYSECNIIAAGISISKELQRSGFWVLAFYAGEPFTEHHLQVAYGTQCLVRSCAPSRCSAHVEVYFDSCTRLVPLDADKISTCDPGLPGGFKKGDSAFLCDYTELVYASSSDRYMYLDVQLFSCSRRRKNYGRGSRVTVIGHACWSLSHTQVRIEVRGASGSFDVCASKISRTAPVLVSGMQLGQKVFYIGETRQYIWWTDQAIDDVPYGEMGTILFQASKDSVMVSFTSAGNCEVGVSDLSTSLPYVFYSFQVGDLVCLRTNAVVHSRPDYRWYGYYFSSQKRKQGAKVRMQGDIGRIVGFTKEHVLVELDQDTRCKIHHTQVSLISENDHIIYSEFGSYHKKGRIRHIQGQYCMVEFKLSKNSTTVHFSKLIVDLAREKHMVNQIPLKRTHVLVEANELKKRAMLAEMKELKRKARMESNKSKKTPLMPKGIPRTGHYRSR